MPDWYLSKPEVSEFEMRMFVRPWEELSTTRQIGMARGPIPHDRIIGYLRDWGYPRDMWRAMVAFIRTVDNHYLAWCDAQSKAKA